MNCGVYNVVSFGYNYVTDTSCGLNGPGDVAGGANPMLGELAENGGLGQTRMPAAGSPVLDRIPAALCNSGPLAEVLEGEQHLEGLVPDRRTLLSRDQRGVPKPRGPACDVGAVEREG